MRRREIEGNIIATARKVGPSPLAHVMMMELVAADISFLIRLVVTVLVAAVTGAIVIAGLYQIVQDKIRESRQLDEIAQETLPAMAASRTVVRQDDDTPPPGGTWHERSQR